jgi:hypothetical protein
MILRVLATAARSATPLGVASMDPEPSTPEIRTCQSGVSPFPNSKVDFVVDGDVKGKTVSAADGTWTICWTER